MKKIFITISILWMMAFVSIMKAQEYQGIVYETNNEAKNLPLPGVNIYWAGTQTGTVTGMDGKFMIESPANNSTLLVFSFVGYQKDTIDVSNMDQDRLIEVDLSLNKTLQEVEIISVARGSVISRLDPIFTQNLNQKEFRKAACCNLSESFETNASVDVSYSDAVSGAKQIMLLGLAGRYSQIQVENIPNLRGLSSTYGLEYVPGTWMESIQISKGTSSVRNGYESITGQINVEYKKPLSSEKLFLNTYVNNLGRLEGNFNTAFRLNENWSTMLMGNVVNSKSEIDNNGDSFLDVPKIEQYQFFNRWKFDYPEKIRGQVGIKVLEETRSGGQTAFDEDQPRDTSNAYGINIKTRRYQVFAKSGLLFERPETSIGFLNSLIYHDQGSFFGFNDYSGNQLSYYGNLMYQTYLFNEHHNYTIGVSYVYDVYEEVLNDSAFSRTERVPGAFVEYTYSIEERLTLLAGLRSDFHNLYGTLITPRFHLRYAPNENWIFRGSAGKGYRSPNVIAENSYILATSKKLIIQQKPEMEGAWNFGLSLTKYTDIMGKQLIVNADFYRTEFINQLIVDMDQDIFEVNVYNLDGQSFANSFQVEANYEPLQGLELTAAYRYNDVQITLNDQLQRKPLVNKYKGLLSATYTTQNMGWQFDFTAQFNGDARLPDTKEYPEQYRRPVLSSEYTIFNAQVTKYLGRWELYLGVENLGDFTQDDPIIASDDPFGNYFDTSLIWGPIVGRKIYFGMRYSIPMPKGDK